MKTMRRKITTAYQILFVAIVSLLLASCQKNDNSPNPNPNPGPQDNSLGLTLASSAETMGIPNTPQFLLGDVPASVALDMPPVGNQGQQGSCTSWSTAYAGMSFFMNRLNGTHYASNQQLCSPKYVYNQITRGACGGTSIPSNLNVLLNNGVCTLSDMPYSDLDCSIQPNATQNAGATLNKIFSWKMVDKTNTNVIKSCLLAKYPVFIALTVDESFDNLQPPYIWSAKYGATRGNHAVTVVGYDDAKGAFKIQNSWGTGWGDKGHLWIAYSFFANAVVGNECYIAFPLITGPNDNLNNGLVLNMPFSGNAKDVSGNNNHGKVKNVTLTADRKGNANSAYKFGGYSNPGGIVIPGSATINDLNAYSICLWTKFDSNSGDNGYGNGPADGNAQVSWQTLFYKGGDTWAQYQSGFRFLLSSQGNVFGLYFGSGSGGNVSGAYSKTNEWHHYVISKSNGVLKMYKDGVLVWDLSSSYANLTGNNFDLLLGICPLPGNGIPFNGALDDVRLYNRALTASEVQKLYKL